MQLPSTLQEAWKERDPKGHRFRQSAETMPRIHYERERLPYRLESTRTRIDKVSLFHTFESFHSTAPHLYVLLLTFIRKQHCHRFE